MQDTLVAIIRQIDCGSLFKTFRLVSQRWKKLTDQVHPTGDEKFADNEVTLIYLNKLYKNLHLLKWVFSHNIQINSHMMEKICGFNLFRTTDKDPQRRYTCLAHLGHPIEVVIKLFMSYFIRIDIYDSSVRIMEEFIHAVTWHDGVCRLTDRAIEIILQDHDERRTPFTWNFDAIYYHGNSIPFSTTKLLLEKFGSDIEVNLFKRYRGPDLSCKDMTVVRITDPFLSLNTNGIPQYWLEMIDLGYYHRLGKTASMEILNKLLTSKKIKRSDIESDVCDNPTVTMEFLMQWGIEPANCRNLTLQMIDENPDIFTEYAIENVIISDENIQEIMNHRLFSQYSLITSCCKSLRHALIMAERLSIPKTQNHICHMVCSYFLDTPKFELDKYLHLFSLDWDGHVKTLSWKLAWSIIVENPESDRKSDEVIRSKIGSPVPLFSRIGIPSHNWFQASRQGPK